MAGDGAGGDGNEDRQVEVTVTFPLAQGKPFHEEDPAVETVGEVKSAAEKHFGVTEEAGSAYYLTHEGARVSDTSTLRDVAGRAEGIKFTLVKELIQG